jgi:hypothetical protein
MHSTRAAGCPDCEGLAFAGVLLALIGAVLLGGEFCRQAGL